MYTAEGFLKVFYDLIIIPDDASCALALDHDGLLFRDLRLLFLREGETENAVFEFSLYICFIDTFAYIEASLHSAGESLLAEHLAFGILFLIADCLCSTYYQITVIESQTDLILLEARQIDVEYIVVVLLTHIGLHETISALAEHLAVSILECRKIEIHKAVKKIVVEKSWIEHSITSCM